MNFTRESKIGVGLCLALTLVGTGFIKGSDLLPGKGILKDADITVIDLPYAEAQAISPNGQIVAGYQTKGGIFTWTKATGSQLIAKTNSSRYGDVTGVLDNGTVYGYYYTEDQGQEQFHPFIWEPRRGFLDLNYVIDGRKVRFIPKDSVPDGSLFVGNVDGGSKYYWPAYLDRQRKVHLLPVPETNQLMSGQTIATSDDGGVILGDFVINYDRTPVQWKNSELQPLIRHEIFDRRPEFRSISSDGSAILTESAQTIILHRGNRDIEVYKPAPPKVEVSYDKPNQFGTGNIVIPVAVGIRACEVSKDGQVVLSQAVNNGVLEPFIWTEQTGVKFFSPALREAHIRLPEGSSLYSMRDLSGNGKTIVGSVMKNRILKPLILQWK